MLVAAGGREHTGAAGVTFREKTHLGIQGTMSLSRIWPESNELDSLIVAARAGSPGALGMLLERCRDYLLLVAGRELGRDLQGKIGASDLVQETFVRAQEVFGSFQGTHEKEFLGWLRKMLLNQILAVRRHYSETLKRDISREVSWTGDISVQAAAESVPTSGDSPATCLIVNEEAAALYEAVESLPADYRQIITLRYWKALSFEEIGAKMERSPAAARKLFARALGALKFSGDGERGGS
jgi:RNA polymerase sigma-70 factor, ECF subfamily